MALAIAMFRTLRCWLCLSEKWPGQIGQASGGSAAMALATPSDYGLLSESGATIHYCAERSAVGRSYYCYAPLHTLALALRSAEG